MGSSHSSLPVMGDKSDAVQISLQPVAQFGAIAFPDFRCGAGSLNPASSFGQCLGGGPFPCPLVLQELCDSESKAVSLFYRA
jgi:hypothetical protein